MITLNEAHAFNTGRQYTEEGQVIGYMVVSSDGNENMPSFRLAFHDVSRGIHGHLTIFAHESASLRDVERYLMLAYDASQYDAGLYDANALAQLQAAIEQLRNPVQGEPAPQVVERQTVHRFDSTVEAYDETQCNEGIEDGDTLVILDERVIGLADTWPVAVSAQHGELHGVAPTFNAERWMASTGITLAQIKAAAQVAVGHLIPLADWVINLLAEHAAPCTPEPTATPATNQVNPGAPYPAEPTPSVEVMPYIKGGVRVVVSEFGRDLNGNAIADYTVFTSQDDLGWHGLYTVRAYSTPRRQQIGFGGWCDEYADSALNYAGLLPMDYMVVNRSGSRSDGQVCLDYLPRDMEAAELDGLLPELMARGITTPAQLGQLERQPVKVDGVWRARV